jgi:hypothetical protein
MGRKRREEPDGTFQSLPIFTVMLRQVLIFAKSQFLAQKIHSNQGSPGKQKFYLFDSQSDNSAKLHFDRELVMWYYLTS